MNRIVNNMKKKTFDFIDMKFDLFFKNINNINLMVRFSKYVIMLICLVRVVVLCYN